jgi:hypothetical protein
MPAWASTVPSAEPSSPRSRPKTSTSSSTTLTTLAATTMTSGVRRSATPRSHPWPASAMSAIGTPSAAIRR